MVHSEGCVHNVANADGALQVFLERILENIGEVGMDVGPELVRVSDDEHELGVVLPDDLEKI